MIIIWHITDSNIINNNPVKYLYHISISSNFDPQLLIEALRRFPFDTALVAASVLDHFIYSFAEEFLPVAARQGVGVVAAVVSSGSAALSPQAARNAARKNAAAVLARRRHTLPFDDGNSLMLILTVKVWAIDYAQDQADRLLGRRSKNIP